MWASILDSCPWFWFGLQSNALGLVIFSLSSNNYVWQEKILLLERLTSRNLGENSICWPFCIALFGNKLLCKINVLVNSRAIIKDYRDWALGVWLAVVMISLQSRLCIDLVVIPTSRVIQLDVMYDSFRMSSYMYCPRVVKLNEFCIYID